MTFLNPFLLFGSLLAIVPLIIHLWSKRQAKKIDFSSLLFLLEAHKKSVKRLQLKNIFLLILRMLILVLISVALSRPILSSGLPLFAPIKAKTSCVIILDNSFSMGYTGLKESSFEAAKRKALEVVASLQNGDSASLILMSDHPKLVFKNLTKRLDDVAKALQKAKLSQRKTEVYESLNQAFDLINPSSDPNKEIYLITDLTQNGWDNFQKNLDVKGIKIFLVDVGEADFQNGAVESVRFPHELIGVGMPFKFEVVVANHSQNPIKNSTLSFIVDEVKLYEVEVNLKANSKATYLFTHRFEYPGIHTGKVELTRDRLQVDDIRYFAVNVYGQLRVICAGDKTLYLRLALSPQSSVSYSRSASVESIITPTIVSESEFSRVDLANYEVAILADVSKISKSEEEKLQNFLANGHGVIIFVGGNASAESYNQTEIMPAQIGARRSNLQAPLFISDYEKKHLVFAIFDDQLVIGSDSPRFYRWYPVDLKRDSTVLAKFNNGSPAIVESSWGNGRLVLINASPSDIEWSNLPLKSLFLPLIQQLVMYLKSGQISQNINLSVGEPFSDSLSFRGPEFSPDFAKSIQIYPPSNPDEPVLIASENGKFQFEQTENAGIYKVEVFGSSQVKRSFFAVNVAPEESELKRASEPEVMAKVGNSGRLIPASSKFQVFRKSLSSARSGREIWRELLVAASVLLLLETLISNGGRTAKAKAGELL